MNAAFLPILPLLATTLGTALGAQQITVDACSDDVVDFGGAQMVGDLPGPDGLVTIREAVLAANHTPGPQTIVFEIPRERWWTVLGDDVAMIWLEDMLYLDGDDTVIDFSTQTSFTGDTNPDGNEVALYYGGPPAGIPGLYIAADRCFVRGLDRVLGNNVGNAIWISGNENRVVGCTTTGLEIRGFFGGGRANVIGGTSPGEGNTFYADVDVLMSASDNVFVGNRFRGGLRIAGDTYYGYCERNRVGGPSAAERNVLAGNGRWGEEGFPIGTQLALYSARDTHVEGNYVGTTDDGMARYEGHSGTGGIVVDVGAEDTLVRGNVVAGIAMDGTNHYQGQRFGVGIAVRGSAARTTIERNLVGVGADGLTPIPNRAGILVQKDPNGTPDGVLVGGAAGAGNVVAHNEMSAVAVGYDTPGVRIAANSIHENGALGIDLLTWNQAGVTPNDPLDADTEGGNHLQNFPRLTGAVRAGSTILASGVLESEPLRAYAVELYASATADPSGHGEGELFLGSVAVATDTLGRASFHASFATAVPPGWVLSATATDLARGETSEFSRVRGVKRALIAR